MAKKTTKPISKNDYPVPKPALSDTMDGNEVNKAILLTLRKQQEMLVKIEEHLGFIAYTNMNLDAATMSAMTKEQRMKLEEFYENDGDDDE